MSTERVVRCDRCGKEIKDVNYAFGHVKPRPKRYILYFSSTYSEDLEFDLCKKCADELDEFFANRR